MFSQQPETERERTKILSAGKRVSRLGWKSKELTDSITGPLPPPHRHWRRLIGTLTTLQRIPLPPKKSPPVAPYHGSYLLQKEHKFILEQSNPSDLKNQMPQI